MFSDIKKTMPSITPYMQKRMTSNKNFKMEQQVYTPYYELHKYLLFSYQLSCQTDNIILYMYKLYESFVILQITISP